MPRFKDIRAGDAPAADQTSATPARRRRFGSLAEHLGPANPMNAALLLAGTIAAVATQTARPSVNHTRTKTMHDPKTGLPIDSLKDWMAANPGPADEVILTKTENVGKSENLGLQ